MPVFYTKDLKNYTADQPDEWNEDSKDKQGKTLKGFWSGVMFHCSGPRL
jgi:hypothetical protein